jgi:universal stress protein A
MFQHILVPTDFSENSGRTLEIAVNIAKLSQGRVSLLHVIKTIPNATFDEFADFYKKLERRAEQEMNQLLKPYHRSPVKVESNILYGNRVQEILRFTTDQNVDLIVMDSHRIDLTNPGHGWGTISYKVSMLAQCPIMLIK